MNQLDILSKFLYLHEKKSLMHKCCKILLQKGSKFWPHKRYMWWLLQRSKLRLRSLGMIAP